MALTDLLPTTGLGFGGATPPIYGSTIVGGPSSKLHNMYSINSVPNVYSLVGKAPSLLDLNGLTPPTYPETGPVEGRY